MGRTAAAADCEVQEFGEWVEALLLDRPDEALLVIRAVMDESGTHEDADVLCVATVAGTSRQWKKWAEAWYPAVRAEFGTVEAYHAKDASDKLNKLLAGLIWRHMDFACAFVTSETDFANVVSHRKRSYYGSAYSFGVQSGLTHMGEFYRMRGKRKKAALVIEAGHKSQSAVDQFLSGVLARGPDLETRYALRSYSWVGKDEPLIHPADLVAHEVAFAWPDMESPVLATMRDRLAIHVFDERLLGRLEDELPSPGYIKKLRKERYRNG